MQKPQMKSEGVARNTYATSDNYPDLKAIAENAPEGTLAVIVTVINNNDTDNLLVMLAHDLLDRLSATDRIEVAGAPIHGGWGRWCCGLDNRYQGLAFAAGAGPEISGFRVVSGNQENWDKIRDEVQHAIAWRRSQGHTVEYFRGDNE